MGQYRALRSQTKRRSGWLAGAGAAIIAAAVSAAGLAIAMGPAEALAKAAVITRKSQAPQAGVVIDFANAIPMPLPDAMVRPASPAEAMLNAPAPSFAKPRSRPGSVGTGRTSPVTLVAPQQIRAKSESNQAVPQEFGTGGVPYTTSQVNAFFDDTDLHYPFSAAGKLFFNIGTGTFLCSASLIARGVAVTAAHCVANFGQNQFYANWQYVPSYNNGTAPFGVSTAKSVTVLQPYLDGTDPCSQAGVICQDDVAVITLNPVNGVYVGTNTGWLGVAADGYGFNAVAQTQVTQLGYPAALDGGGLMERNDSMGIVDGANANNTIIGSLMTGGSSGGPWVLNLGMPPVLAGTAFGQAAVHNLVAGVTSWGYTVDDIKLQGASPFTSGNVFTLLGAACAATPSACQ